MRTTDIVMNNDKHTRSRWSLDRLSLNSKVVLVIVVVFLGLTALTVLSSLRSRAVQLQDRENLLKAQISSATSIVAAYYKQAQAGTLSRAAAEQQAFAQLGDMRWGDGTGYVFVFDDDYVLKVDAVEPNAVGKSVRDQADRNGKLLWQAMYQADHADGHGITRYVWPKLGSSGLFDKISYSQYFQPWGLNIGAGAYTDDIGAQFRQTLASELGTAAIVGLGVVFLVWLSMRSIRKSIGGEPEFVVRVVNQMAIGNLASDEIGDAAAPAGSMVDALQRLRLRLIEILGSLQQTGDGVRRAAEQISSGNDRLSQRTQEAAASLAETASSMEEITSTVRQNADNAQQANQLVQGAREQAEHGGAIAAQAVAAMDGISVSSGKIVDIAGLIDDIAFQTNLLALNAAVEAARAGDQGRGFAVVASEVRNLAQRSAAAAKEVKTLIAESVGKVKAGGALVAESGRLLMEIVNSVKRVTDIVGEIAAASQEQSAGIEQVNKAVTQMDEVTQQNAALVEASAAAAHGLDEQAAILARDASFFQIRTERSIPEKVGAELARVAKTVDPAGVEPRHPARLATAPRRREPSLAASGVPRAEDQGWKEF